LFAKVDGKDGGECLTGRISGTSDRAFSHIGSLSLV